MSRVLMPDVTRWISAFASAGAEIVRSGGAELAHELEREGYRELAA